jgi:hypothetical protein
MAIPERRQMTNHAYLEKPEGVLPKSKNFRKNKYEIDRGESHSQPHQSRPIESKTPPAQVPFL